MSNKPFGLIVKSKKAEAAPKIKKVAAFGESDDDEDEMALSVFGQRQSASTIRATKKIELIHETAMAEDPSIYDYDSFLDKKEEQKAIVEEEKRAENKGRKEAKYAGKLMQAHAKRELEKQLRDERKQLKEREAEMGQFDDKEVFVTSSYKKQLELVEEFKKEQMESDKFDELTAVGKQKMWQQGFHRTLLETLSAGRNGPSTSAAGESKEKNDLTKLRKLLVDEDGLDLGGVTVKQKDKKDSRKAEKKEEEKPKKSIYDSDSDVEKEEVPKAQKPEARFEEELLPGLNKPRLAQTRQQEVQSRFTPTPEGSSESEAENELSSRRRRPSRSPVCRRRSRSRDRNGRKERRRRSRSRSASNDRSRSDRRKDRESRNSRSLSVDRKRPHSRSKSKTPESKTPETAHPKKMKLLTKEERLVNIKKILSQRNDSCAIEEMRQRYLDRREENVVPLPY
ncbi:hypothetical protein L596_024328 [Steinernema carpocapsae]|uniref:Nuclear speckle splicing regulatory protein 1 N-terminal domain-containing protein n=1 Tax=Steinernema carpocapsae TaxID=34508 RepID=A0A4U5MH54_STECR|nr:hypothetical protein L596_024328 [Steinernema carpocapsae]